jgi:hypothetical protein
LDDRQTGYVNILDGATFPKVPKDFEALAPALKFFLMPLLSVSFLFHLGLANRTLTKIFSSPSPKTNFSGSMAKARSRTPREAHFGLQTIKTLQSGATACSLIGSLQ